MSAFSVIADTTSPGLSLARSACLAARPHDLLPWLGRGPPTRQISSVVRKREFTTLYCANRLALLHHHLILDFGIFTMSAARSGSFLSSVFSMVDKGYEYLVETPPRAPNAKAFQVGAFFGEKIMKSRLGPYVAKAGHKVYPFALAVLAPAVPRGVNQVIVKTIRTRQFSF